jgi:hypothetical protein
MQLLDEEVDSDAAVAGFQEPLVSYAQVQLRHHLRLEKSLVIAAISS